MAEASSEGFEQIKARLQRMIAAKQEALKASGVAVLTESQKTITSGGNGWAPWSTNYKPKRVHQMLWDTGTLLRSLSIGDEHNIFRTDGDDSIVVGSNVKYAAAQNYGYSPRNLPARPYLVLNAQVEEVAKKAFAAQLQRAFNS
jgi:phage gpG-like protein